MSMIWYNSIWHVPQSVTDEEDIVAEFERVFNGNAKIPRGGIMPQSNGNGGASIVGCLLPYEYFTALELTEDIGWQVWGYQSLDGTIVDVPVKQNLVKNHYDNDITKLHQFGGQSAWVLD